MILLILYLLAGPQADRTPTLSLSPPPRQSCKAERIRAGQAWLEREIVNYSSNPLLALRCRG